MVSCAHVSRQCSESSQIHQFEWSRSNFDQFALLRNSWNRNSWRFLAMDRGRRKNSALVNPFLGYVTHSTQFRLLEFLNAYVSGGGGWVRELEVTVSTSSFPGEMTGLGLPERISNDRPFARQCRLSSIRYTPKNEMFLFSTSYENNEKDEEEETRGDYWSWTGLRINLKRWKIWVLLYF